MAPASRWHLFRTERGREMLIIGFTGPPGAGKDTAYEIIKQAATPSWKVERFSFADPLRAMADELMDLPEGHDYWGQDRKDQPSVLFNGHTPRDLLIELGMLGRKYNPTIWLSLASRAIAESKADVAVITDVRFVNEAERVLELGGLLVDIVRPGHVYDPGRESESGQAAMHANRTLLNMGDMPAFQRAVETLWWTEICRHLGLKIEMEDYA